MKKTKTKKKGSARMRQLGRVAVVIWLTESEAEKVDQCRGYFKRAAWAKARVMAVAHADYQKKLPA